MHVLCNNNITYQICMYAFYSFEREFQLMAFAPDDGFLSSD